MLKRKRLWSKISLVFNLTEETDPRDPLRAGECKIFDRQWALISITPAGFHLQKEYVNVLVCLCTSHSRYPKRHQAGKPAHQHDSVWPTLVSRIKFVTSAYRTDFKKTTLTVFSVAKTTKCNVRKWRHHGQRGGGNRTCVYSKEI